MAMFWQMLMVFLKVCNSCTTGGIKAKHASFRKKANHSASSKNFACVGQFVNRIYKVGHAHFGVPGRPIPAVVVHYTHTHTHRITDIY